MINKKGLILQFIFLISSFLFVFANPVRASELNLPYNLRVAGLSFDFPFSRVNKASGYELLLNFQIEPDTLYITDASNLDTFTSEPQATPLPSIEPTTSPKAKDETKKPLLAKTVLTEPTIKPVSTTAPTLPPAEKPKEEEKKEVLAPLENATGGLNPEIIFNLINDYREGNGLSRLEKDERACSLAKDRANEIGAEIAGGYMHKGLKDRNLSYWNSENIIDMNSEENAVKWWINDYIHRVQIEGDYKYSCVACLGTACAQEFTNFTPKG